MRRWMIGLTFLMCVISLIPVQAQENLLGNAGFENNYSGRGRGDFNFAEGWGGWFTTEPSTESWMNQPPNAFPHSAFYKYGGAFSQSISKGGGTFTAAAYQEVGNIPAGAIVRGSAFVFIENASDRQARVRIGVGSNVGDNPFGAITWSNWETTLNEFRQISVDHVATGGSVTIFIYATQDWPNDPNAVYFDDASLVIVGQGEAPAEGDGDSEESAAPTAPEPPRPSGVAFVSPQDTSAGDGISHTVQGGDTLASIATGYGVPMDEIMGLNGLDRSSVLQIGQVLTIATPDPNATPEPTVAPTATPEPETEVVEAEPAVTEAVEDNTAAVVVTTDEEPSELQPLPSVVTDDSEPEATDATEVVQLDPNLGFACTLRFKVSAPFLVLSCDLTDSSTLEN